MFYVKCNYNKRRNLGREYRDCIKSRRDKIGITRHIMMHQVLYIVQLPDEEDDMHIIEQLAMVHHGMPCDPNLVSSAFYTLADTLRENDLSFTVHTIEIALSTTQCSRNSSCGRWSLI